MTGTEVGFVALVAGAGGCLQGALFGGCAIVDEIHAWISSRPLNRP